MASSKLYIIATPIGHRDDITLRAVATLRELSCLFAEDTRELSKLLDLLGIPASGKRMYSYASHNLKEATEKAVGILREGISVGLASDRGTPGISDPGARLVDRAREEGFPIVPIPGASSLTSLLSVAGGENDRFSFVGFLPVSKSERADIFGRIEASGWAACLFESPKRVRATASELKTRFPRGRLFVGREMTKVFESFLSFDLAEFSPEALPEMGEYALLVHPGEKAASQEAWREEVSLRLASEKEWAKVIAARHGTTAKDVYNALQELKRHSQV